MYECAQVLVVPSWVHAENTDDQKPLEKPRITNACLKIWCWNIENLAERKTGTEGWYVPYIIEDIRERAA
jgi:hypothetical protein